jgi:hypothetical protein
MIDGANFDIKSTASAALLLPTATLALAHAYDDYIAYFHVTTPESFYPLISVSADATTTGIGQSFEYLAFVFLYDTTSPRVIADEAYYVTSGRGSLYQIPTRVDLIPGEEYFLAGETYVFAAVGNQDGKTVGSVSGAAEATFNLVAVPEPSTLAVAGLGFLSFVVRARRLRRSAA